METISLNIAGDVFMGGRIEPIAMRSPRELFDTKILELFSSSDYNILNLESPLTEAGPEHQIIKTGPNLKASPDTIRVLNVLKTNLVTLANNHIYDYGKKGLADTFELCRKNQIATVGAGQNLDEASQIFLKKIKGITIAVVNIAENEWCNADDTRGGANPMNIISNTRSINRAKEIADIVLLIIHGGHELYYYPSPRMIDQYRFYAEQGASLIISHHSHCISGYEVHNNIPIFYGLGNFLFDSTTDFEGWYKGILLNIQINSDKKITWKLHPYKQIKDNFKVEILEGLEKEELEKQIESICSTITDSDEIKKRFYIFSNRQEKDILSMFSTSYFIDNHYFRSAIKKFGLEKFFLRHAQLKSILNYSRCEAHRDISSRIILDYINSK
jgi:poly-gamma-glutamate synthesis protein (capsule biosynthesis protein)